MISTYSWTRKGQGRPGALPRVRPARKGRAIVTEARGFFSIRVPLWLAISATILAIAVSRTATTPHSPASSLHSFQEPGAFSSAEAKKLQKQMEGNYRVFLSLLNGKQKQINELKKRTSAIKDAELLPDAWH